MLLARALVRTPFGAFVRWLAGGTRPPRERTFEERIAAGAELLIRDGYEPIAALAAAEAVETGRARQLYLHGVVFDDKRLQWHGVYEAGLDGDAPLVHLPLPHASAAMQRGTAVLN